jgi:DNA-binding NtrC family response regulator
MAAALADAAIRDRLPGRIELLLSDIRMPGASGPELCRLIWRQRPGMRFLLMSGYSDAPIAPRFAFMYKPFTIPQLIENVRSVLEGATGGLSVSSSPA